MHASTLDTPLFRSINTDCSPPSDGYSDRAGTLGHDIFGDAKASVSAPDSTHSRSFDAQSLTPDYTQSLAPQFMLGSECDVWFGEPVIPTSPCLSSRLDTALDATVKEVEEAELSTLLGSRAPSLHVHGIPSLPAGIAPWTSFRTTNIDAISVLDRVRGEAYGADRCWSCTFELHLYAMDGEGEGDGGFVVECQRRSGSALLFGATYRALTRQLRVEAPLLVRATYTGVPLWLPPVEPPVSDEVVDCDTQTLVSLLEMAASPRADTQLEGVRTLAALAAFPSNHSVLVASRQLFDTLASVLHVASRATLADTVRCATLVLSHLAAPPTSFTSSSESDATRAVDMMAEATCLTSLMAIACNTATSIETRRHAARVLEVCPLSAFHISLGALSPSDSTSLATKLMQTVCAQESDTVLATSFTNLASLFGTR